MFMTEEEKQEEIISEEWTQEEENLNWWEKKTYSLEEVEAIKKEMQSNSEKGVQKIIWEKRAYEKAMSSLDEIAEDQTKLIDLFSEDEKAGKIILDKYYNWQSIEEFKNSIDYEVDVTDPKVMEQLIEDKVKARELEKDKARTEKQINDEKEKFIKDYDMSWEELKKFEEEFEDRKNLKSFSLKTIKTQLEKAYRDWNPNEETLAKIKQNQAIAETLGSAGWKGTWKSKSWKAKIKESIEEELDDFFDTYG